MKTRASRGLTLIEIVVVMAIIIVLGLLLLLFLQRAKDTSRQTSCTNNLHQIGVALNTYALENKVYPPASTINLTTAAEAGAIPAFNAQKVGKAVGQGKISLGDAGYNWIVMILPSLGETALYQKIASTSGQFKSEPAFSPLMVNKDVSGATTTTRHLATFPLAVLICPNFGGQVFVPQDNTISAYKGTNFSGKDTAGIPYGVAISNYVAMSASHIECMKPIPSTLTGEKPNGVIIPGKGIGPMSITDGDSKTIVVCETKEQYYSSWYDGTTGWNVALWPDGKTQALKNETTQFWECRDTTSASGAAIGKGPVKGAPSQLHYAQARAKDALAGFHGSWEWGPSSDHNNGDLVNHLFGDAATRTLNRDINPDVYMYLVTRAGGEADTPSW